jgi:outer membrane protein TolC
MIFGLADLKNKGDAITQGLKLVAYSERRRELGFLSPYEVKQAEVQLSFDRENLLLAKNVFLERQFIMKSLVLPAFETRDRQIYLPTEIPSLKVPPLRRDDLLAIAYQKRLDYKAAILGAEAEDVRLKFARNQAYPQLDIVGSYGWSGLDSSYPSAVGQMMESQANQWQIGITGGFPLGGIQPRAQIDAAKARKEQAILRVKKSELNVGLAVERAMELIRTNQKRLEAARFTVVRATEAVRVGFRRMEEGLISNFDLIEQQRRLYDARTRELNAVAELNKSITQLWLATGTVLENLNISIGGPGDGKTVQKVKTSVTTTTVTDRKAKR